MFYGRYNSKKKNRKFCLQFFLNDSIIIYQYLFYLGRQIIYSVFSFFFIPILITTSVVKNLLVVPFDGNFFFSLSILLFFKWSTIHFSNSIFTFIYHDLVLLVTQIFDTFEENSAGFDVPSLLRNSWIWFSFEEIFPIKAFCRDRKM